jgi:hypothetical protein
MPEVSNRVNCVWERGHMRPLCFLKLKSLKKKSINFKNKLRMRAESIYVERQKPQKSIQYGPRRVKVGICL